MRKSSMALVVLTLAVLSASAAGVSSAKHCTGTKASPASAHDPFGSCEDGGGSATKGNLHCGSGAGWNTVGAPNPSAPTQTATYAKVYANPNDPKGVQVCNDGTGNPSGPSPVAGQQYPYIIQGRVTVYKDANNNVVASTDGDKDNSTKLHANAAAWSRVDVRPGEASACKKVRVRRAGATPNGTTGTYWYTADGGTSSTADGTPPDTYPYCL